MDLETLKEAIRLKKEIKDVRGTIKGLKTFIARAIACDESNDIERCEISFRDKSKGMATRIALLSLPKDFIELTKKSISEHESSLNFLLRNFDNL